MMPKCPNCGKPNDGTAYICSECTDKQKRRRKERADSGLCTKCGRSLPDDNEGRLRCPKCREKEKAYAEQSRTRRSTARVCVQCQSPLPVEYAYKACPTCLQGRKDLSAYRKAHGLCVACGKPLDRVGAVCRECVEKRKNYGRTHPEKLDALQHYGMKCACCGESRYEFLTIDHINGGGRKHNAEIGQGHLYRWLKKNNYPEGFRVLCHNCNQSLGLYGYCPHQKR